MNVRLDAIVADIVWLADTKICLANERMNQLSAEHKLTVLLERLQSDKIIVVDGSEPTIRYCPGPRVGDEIKGHRVEDEVVRAESLPAVSLLVDEYKRLVNAFDNESISGVV